MRFGTVGRMGSGIMQVSYMGLGIGPREGVILAANIGRPITVTNGEFAA